MSPSVDAHVDALRAALERAPGFAGESPERVDVVVSELRPFVEAAHRCRAAPPTDPSWSEARSLALLFAYRLGDQGYAAGAVTDALLAWRDAAGEAAVLDRLLPLLLDGYARGREDRARASAASRAAAAAPVFEASPRRWVASGFGAADADGARDIVSRTSVRLLRQDAEAVMLDLAASVPDDPSVLLEAVALERDAQSLGVRFVLAASAETLTRLRDAGWTPAADTEVLPTTAAALRSAQWSGGAARVAVGWVAARLGV